MAATVDFTGDVVVDDQLARRNALILAVAQAFGLANNVILFTTASIVGAMLAPERGLATLPVSVYVLGLWAATLPMGALSRRFGRRTAFQIGTFFGVLTGLLCATGLILQSFALFNLGTFCSGFYAAGTQAYRFAAADTASEGFKPRAISWVLTGGIGGAFIGPQLVIATQDLWLPHVFAASFIGQSLLAVVAAGVLSLLRIPRPRRQSGVRGGRPLREIVRQPRFAAAVAAGVASYAVMNMIMTAAPLAMVMSGHPTRDATLGIQWHALAMFLPSFFTGRLIGRFGAERVVAVGLALHAATAAVELSGIGIVHFWSGLILLGLGWNLGFIGATAMVTGCYRPEERTTVQAFNDFMIFGTMALGSFVSGSLLAAYGWAFVNLVVLPMVGGAGIMLVWAMRRPPAPLVVRAGPNQSQLGAE